MIFFRKTPEKLADIFWKKKLMIFFRKTPEKLADIFWKKKRINDFFP